MFVSPLFLRKNIIIIIIIIIIINNIVLESFSHQR